MEPNKGQTLTVTRWIFQCVIATFCLSISFAETGFADACSDGIQRAQSSCQLQKAYDAWSCMNAYHLSSESYTNPQCTNGRRTGINPVTTSCFKAAQDCLRSCGRMGDILNMNLTDFIGAIADNGLQANGRQKKCLEPARKLSKYMTGKINVSGTDISGLSGSDDSLCTIMDPQNSDNNPESRRALKADHEATTFKQRCQRMSQVQGSFRKSSVAPSDNGEETKQQNNGSYQIANGRCLINQSTGVCEAFQCDKGYTPSGRVCKKTSRWNLPEKPVNNCEDDQIPDGRGGCKAPSPIDQCSKKGPNFKIISISGSPQCIDCSTSNHPQCKKTPPVPKPKMCENGGAWNDSKNECDCPAPWEGSKCERKKACDEHPTPTGDLIILCDPIKKSEYKKCIKDPKMEWVNNQCKPKKEDPNPTDPEKKACENAIAAGQKKMWNDAMGTCEDIEGPEEPEKPEDPQNITKDDVDKLKKAMDEAAANLGGGGGNGLGGGNNGIPNAGKINVGDNNGGGFDSSGFDSSDDSGRSSDFGGVAADATPRSPVPLFRGKTPIVGVKRDNQQNAGNGQPGNGGGGGGLGGNPGGFGGGNNAKAAKLKKKGGRGRSRLWEAAKQLVSGSYFGGGGGGAPSGGPRNHQQAQKNSRRFVPDGRGGYVDTKGMTTAELRSLNESFRANIPGYQQRYAPASHGLLGDEYNQQVTIILKKEVMLNRYGCEPPLTSCDAVKRLTASAKRKRRPSSVKSKKKRSRKKYRKKRRIKRRRKKRK